MKRLRDIVSVNEGRLGDAWKRSGQNPKVRAAAENLRFNGKHMLGQIGGTAVGGALVGGAITAAMTKDPQQALATAKVLGAAGAGLGGAAALISTVPAGIKNSISYTTRRAKALGKEYWKG
jgi:hypothetical protein